MLMIVTTGLKDIKKDIDNIKIRVENLESHTKILNNDKDKDKESNSAQKLDNQQTTKNDDSNKTNTLSSNNNPVNDQGLINPDRINILHGGNYTEQRENNDNNKRRARFS